MTYFDTANFRRPRRASQKQRRAARDLGRKRRGRRRDQWKGIALAGGAIVSVGATVAGANALRNRGGSSSFTPQRQSSQASPTPQRQGSQASPTPRRQGSKTPPAPQPPPPPDNSGRVPDTSPSAKVTVPGFLGLSPQVRRRVLDKRLEKLQLQGGSVEKKMRAQAHGNPGFYERPSEAYDNRFDKEKNKPRSGLRDPKLLAHQKAQLSRLDAYKGVARSAGKKQNVAEINRIMAEASAKVDPAKYLSRAAATVEPRRRNMRANAYLRLTAFRRQSFQGVYFN